MYEQISCLDIDLSSSSGYPEIATYIVYLFSWLGRLALPSGSTALTQYERYRRYIIENNLCYSEVNTSRNHALTSILILLC